MCGVIVSTTSVVTTSSVQVLKSLPMPGRSPSQGTVFLVFRMSSCIKPPITMVSSSRTISTVSAVRVPKRNCLISGLA
jgi:hypothetical protein